MKAAWAMQEPDGLCHIDAKFDPDTNEIVPAHRGPWPNGGTMSNHVGKASMPTWTQHVHSDDCLVPIAEAKLEPDLWHAAFVKLKSAGTAAPIVGTDRVEWDGWVIRAFCRELTLPVLRNEDPR